MGEFVKTTQDSAPSTCKRQPAETGKALAPIDYVCCAFLGLAITAAPQYINKSLCEFNLLFFLTALATFACLLSVTFALRKFLQSMRWNAKLKPTNKLNQAFSKLFNCKHPVLAVAGIILAFWAIPLIFLYPGTVINDTWGQFCQFMKFMSNPFEAEGVLWDHHPIFDTFFMGAIITPVAYFTGHWHLMFFVYVIMQAVFTSLTFSCVVNYAHKKLDLEILPCALILAAFCLFQIYPIAVQNISKDSFHSWVFVLYALFFCELVRTNGDAIKSKKFIVLLTAIALLCCLTKKVGFYIVLVTLVFAIIFLKGRNNKKLILVPIASSAILMLLVMPAFMHITHATPGEKREMLSLPFQMTARYVKDHADEVTDEEYAAIDQLLDMSTLAQRYEHTCSDAVKDKTKEVGIRGYVEYGKAWLAQGLKHPETYVTALNCMMSGWFSWTEYAPLMDMSWHSQLDSAYIPESATTRDISAGTAQAYTETIHNLYANSMLQLFHTFAFWATLIPAFILCTVCRKQAKKGGSVRFWVAILPSFLALVCGCWLAPVSTAGMEGYRYLFPLTYTAPLMIAWCLFMYKNANGVCEPQQTPNTIYDAERP